MNEDLTTLTARIERLESIDAIRQLASRYALGLDSHNLDLLVECFVPDVRVGSSFGRHALKRDFDRRLRNRGYLINTHFVGNHVIEFLDPDHAIGIVYCRAEHEYPDQLIAGPLQYFDEYERQHGRWFFRRRRALAWYMTDVLDRPVGPQRLRWPETDPAEAPMPGWWPSWSRFWEDPDMADTPPAEEGPDGTFLRRARGIADAT
jgi:hypothetical protein